MVFFCSKEQNSKSQSESYTAWKVSKYKVISGPYFPVFGLNTKIYVDLSVYLYIERDTRTATPNCL